MSYACFDRQEEYLLNATSALGIFAQVKGGATSRPPLQWSNNVAQVAFSHPYILTLNDEFITVHRLAYPLIISLSQKLKKIPVNINVIMYNLVLSIIACVNLLNAE